MLVGLTLAVLTFGLYVQDLTRYGATWDERYLHRPFGGLYVDFLRTGDSAAIMRDRAAHWFPPVAVTIGAHFVQARWLDAMLPAEYDRFHVAAVLFGSATVGIVYAIAALASESAWVGLFASLLLAVQPQFVTHSHNNVRDMGLAMFFSLTILLLLVGSGSRRRWWLFAAAGVVGGIATDAKQNGALLALIGPLFMAVSVRSWGWRRSTLAAVVYLAAFFFAVLAFWPYLWQDTVRHLGLVLQFLNEHLGGTATYFDRVYKSGVDLPFHYPWVMLTLLSPPAFAALAWAGLILFLPRLATGVSGHALIVLWMVTPLLRFGHPTSAVCYDQIRHVLEVVPAMAILAALFATAVAERLEGRWWGRWLVVAMASGVVVHSAWVTARYRPYGTAYFNSLAGDATYVNHAFDVDFWGSSYREATAMLNQRYGAVGRYYTPLGGQVFEDEGLLGQFTDSMADEFDFALFMNKQNFIRLDPYLMWLLREKKPVFTIEREGKVVFYQFAAERAKYERWRASVED